jgi:hypothetical protein
MKLIVTNPFGMYCRGEEITEPAQIAVALASNPGHVLKVGAVEVTEAVEPKPVHEEPEPDHPAD